MKEGKNLPSGWTEANLSEASLILMGLSPKGETYNFDQTGLPLINGPAEFRDNYPVPVQWTTQPTKTCEIGDVLFCVRGNTTGRMNLADQKYCIGRGIAAIRGIPNRSDTRFIMYLLEHQRRTIYNIAIGGGSTFPNIGGSQLSKLPVLLPPLSEQRAIATALKAVQDAIAARRRELELERERKAALMQHLFTKGTQNEPTKQTEIGEMPESWELKKLGDEFEIRYGLGQPPELDSDGVPMIRATDIKKGRILSKGVVRVKREAIPEKKKAFLKKRRYSCRPKWSLHWRFSYV